ncbi:MAG TPA: ubiquitin-like protein UBact [Fimbriimonas sp.]|nr:ubiquitin-like protein UBact [Fimbriimonas sp.]
MTDGDRLTRPLTREPEKKLGDDGGPSAPDVRKPGGDNELLKRMKKIDPDQAKRYRQRSGE